MHPDGSGLDSLLDYGYPVWLRWSPDGRSILFSSSDGLHILDLTTRTERLIPGTYAPDLTDYQRGDWSPDGQWIVYNKQALWMMHPDGTDNHCIEDTTGYSRYAARSQ